MYILHDPHELSLPIPHGVYDVPLVLKDAMFTSSGELIFDDNGGSGMFGDVILVNGRPWPAMPVERRKYRFRLLNASVSRSYLLALSTGDPFTVIGTDGGLMPAPAETTSLRFGMAERYEIVIDFAKYPVGTRVVLENRGLPNNIDFDNTGVVMAFDVAAEATNTLNNTVPPVLNPDNAVMRLTAGEAVKTRLMEFKREGGEWTVNGQTWEDVINSGFTQVVASPNLGDVEIWELKNDSGGWFHPVHIHLVDFQILDRNGQPPRPYERGPKDVAYVGEGETVRVLMRFGPQIGRYMMHCHNLVHEDHDMMVQFEVGLGGHDPIQRDRPKHQPAPELHGDEPHSSPSPSSGPGPGPAAPPQPDAKVGSVAPKPKPKKRKVKVKSKKKARRHKPKPKRRRKPKRKTSARKSGSGR
jgi:spore coat protein A, manganese oxidase